MSVEISGRLIAWLAARGHLGDATEYWRNALRGPGPRGGKHRNHKVPRLVYVREWVPEVDVLLSGFNSALSENPCRIIPQSRKTAKVAAAQLKIMKSKQPPTTQL